MAKKNEETTTTNLPMSMEEEIKKQLAAQRGQLGALPTNKISTKGKKFTLPNGQAGEEIEVIILDFVWSMVNYPGVYNPNNPQQPNCFALGRENPMSGQLQPHENSAEPQADSCLECPMNEWGSAPSGGGKACKNQRRLIVMAPDATEGDEAMTLYVSPGGLKHFDAYVSRLSAEHKMLPVQVLTKIYFDPDQVYPLLRFEMMKPNDNLAFFWGKRDASQELLFRPIETEKSKAA